MRKLKAEEIECRVSTVSKKGCSLLLYKDARVDMKILDEEYGPMNWQREHELIGDNLYCYISVWDKDKEMWVRKEDVGTESYTEKEKGQASDSFKRAGFNWGIGRELYTAPFIWVNAKDVNLEAKGQDQYGNDKYTTYDRFTVKDIKYDGDVISGLEIINEKKKCVAYTYGTLKANPSESKEETTNETTYKPVMQPTKTDKDSKATSAQVDQIKDICGKTGVPIDFITGKYNVESLEELKRYQAYAVVNAWDKVKASYEKTLEGIPFN